MSFHPYLMGNFLPVEIEFELGLCDHEGMKGCIPIELIGGQYLRNGSNPSTPVNQISDYHWFDGDGMVHGVYFSDVQTGWYVNRYIQTEVYLSNQILKTTSVLPSISTLISNSTSSLSLLYTFLRSFILNRFFNLSTLTVANTALVYHDHRLLATCESGPPLILHLPQLQTLDYHLFSDPDTGLNGLGQDPLIIGSNSRWLPHSIAGILEQWTTAHPKLDPSNGELVFIGYNVGSRSSSKHITHLSL